MQKLTATLCCFSLLFSALPAMAGDIPADTYFSVAVSENSHNHYGENLMFLDFIEDPAQRNTHPQVVASPRLKTEGIQLDGDAGEWDASLLTRIRGRVMNNYPLSEHRDAVPGEILVGSAFDDEFVYFLLQFEDMNHDASINRNRWVYKNGNWELSEHTPANTDAPAARAVNRDERLAGKEDEDQIFMMFPIVDRQGNFNDGSLGCAGYCHANLVLSSDPAKSQIGDGVAAMHTALPGDIADLWHWTATRSRPMQSLKDGYIDYGEQSYNGRKSDQGSAPFEDNAQTEPFRPRFVHKGDLEAGHYRQPGFATQALSKQDLVAITPEMVFAEGVTLPFYIGVAASGSQADVETAAQFDDATSTWTVEFKRKRNTGDGKDRQFVAGVDASPPVSLPAEPGDAERGGRLYVEKACADCHGEQGEGRFEDGRWIYPRNQRVSAPLIRKTASPDRPERLQSLVFHLKQIEMDPPDALMPFVPLTPQEAEDIAAWLQQQFIPLGQ
jgi:mono/diheme cytochrome c family protein